MEIKYLETVEEAVNAIKLYTKPRKIGFIICTIYIFIVALYLIIIGDEKLIGYFFIFFTIILGVTNIIKTKKAINNFKRKYEYSYNNEVERNIKIEDDKIRPPLNSIAGLGNVAAESIYQARCEEPFECIEDMQARSKIGKSVTELLEKFGCLKGMTKSNQLSLFI